MAGVNAQDRLARIIFALKDSGTFFAAVSLAFVGDGGQNFWFLSGSEADTFQVQTLPNDSTSQSVVLVGCRLRGGSLGERVLWRNCGKQTFRRVSSGDSAPFPPAFHHWASPPFETPNRIESKPNLPHSVLRRIPTCGTNFHGPYDACGPHKRTKNITPTPSESNPFLWLAAQEFLDAGFAVTRKRQCLLGHEHRVDSSHHPTPQLPSVRRRAALCPKSCHPALTA
jgi:hypothetical protein